MYKLNMRIALLAILICLPLLAQSKEIVLNIPIKGSSVVAKKISFMTTGTYTLTISKNDELINYVCYTGEKCVVELHYSILILHLGGDKYRLNVIYTPGTQL